MMSSRATTWSKLVPVLVQEGVLALIHRGALDHLGGAVTFRHLHPVGDAPHVQLGHRRALAGVDVFGVQHNVELAVHVDDGALAQGTGLNFHVIRSLRLGGRKSADELGGRQPQHAHLYDQTQIR
jgi:hypothetical protein